MSSTTQFGKALGLEFRNATRIQQALTAGVERKALLWLAERTPAWVSVDLLTVVGFAAQILAGVCYAAARWNKYALLGSIFFIALNWLGDSLDGTLARFRNRLRPRYGFYVDHMVDTFGAAALMIGLAVSNYVHWQVAIGMLVAFLVLAVESYLATYTLNNFRLSHGMFGPTEIRILLIAGTVKLLLNPWAHFAGHRFLVFDVGGVIAIAGMAGMAVAATARHTIQLYREERLA